MEISPQSQKAGDNAQQIQAGTIIINNGVSEERVRAVISEMQTQALQEYTELAYQIADSRMKAFKESLMPIIKKNEEDLSFFADPAFQIVLKKAQISAAKTESNDDYDMLAELLENHVKNKEDRKNKAALEKAMEIVTDIDCQALCALTVMYIILNYNPSSGDIVNGLSILNEMYKKIMHYQLPDNNDWIDHLAIFGILRPSPSENFKKYLEFLASRLNGYICVGICKNSENHQKTLELLKKLDGKDINLVDNSLLDGYVRLDIVSKKINHIKLSNAQKNIIDSILKLYSDDKSLLEAVNKKLITLLDNYEYIQKVCAWWDKLPYYVEISLVGKMLAHTNAKRYLPDLPGTP